MTNLELYAIMLFLENGKWHLAALTTLRTMNEALSDEQLAELLPLAWSRIYSQVDWSSSVEQQSHLFCVATKSIQPHVLADALEETLRLLKA